MSKAVRNSLSAPRPRRASRDRLQVVLLPAGHRLAAEIRLAVRCTLRAQGYRRGCLEVVVVGEAEMRRQNLQWKRRRSATDVLSFDLRDAPTAGCVDGQLLVCEAVARRAAKARHSDWRGELLLYVVHGCLHLCGYDDRRRGDAARMHAAEDALLTQLGWGGVYSGSQTRTPAGAGKCFGPESKGGAEN